MPPRVYADTSVIGGVFDPNFAIDSTWIFEEVAQGSLILLVSNVLEAEVSEAARICPSSARGFTCVRRGVRLSRCTGERAEGRLPCGQGRRPQRALDATHVAIATVAARRRTPLLGPSSYRGIGEGTRVQ